jgi:hypothetical protein
LLHRIKVARIYQAGVSSSWTWLASTGSKTTVQTDREIRFSWEWKQPRVGVANALGPRKSAVVVRYLILLSFLRVLEIWSQANKMHVTKSRDKKKNWTSTLQCVCKIRLYSDPRAMIYPSKSNEQHCDTWRVLASSWWALKL